MPIPSYTTADVIMARVARRLGMTQSQLNTDAEWWNGVSQDAATSANLYVHQKLLANLGSAASVLADAGVSEWANQVGMCHALRNGMLTGTFTPQAVNEICKCEEQGDHWIPTVAPVGELAPSRVVTSGPMDTSGDSFTLSMES